MAESEDVLPPDSEPEEPEPEPEEPEPEEPEPEPEPEPGQPEIAQPEPKPAEPKPAEPKQKQKQKRAGVARWLVPSILAVGVIVAMIVYGMDSASDGDTKKPLGPDPGAEAPELVQCLALAKAGKYEFQKGLDIDSNNLDSFAQKLGISNKEIVEAAQNADVDQAIVEACRAQFGEAKTAALSVVSASGVPVGGASVTVKGGYGFAKGCTTDQNGSCTISLPTVLPKDAKLVLGAVSGGKRGSLEASVQEVVTTPIELRLETTLARCTIEVIERPGGTKLFDVERVEVALDSADAPIVAEEGTGSGKGTWSYECTDRAVLGGGKHRVTRGGQPKEFPFEVVELSAILTWSGTASGGGGGGGRSSTGGGPQQQSCASDSKTKKAIRNAIELQRKSDPNIDCASVNVTVTNRRIVDGPAWLKGVELRGAVLDNCSGAVACP